MRLSLARAVTYTVVGVAAAGAVQMTPPPAAARQPGELLRPRGNNLRIIAPTVAKGMTILPSGDIAMQPVIVQARPIQGVDTLAVTGTVHSSLAASLESSAAGELPRSARRSLAGRLADIFEYRVDLSRDLRDGDSFRLVVERLNQPNGKIIVNKILGARLAVRGKDFEAIRFQSDQTSSQYFDASGNSLSAAFLRAPVAFRRISSVFGNRKHPIFKTWKNHTGTDYAASYGTPVKSIGDGVVIAAGPRGGYGNAIDIRHSNGYVSRYAHMSRLARGMRAGARVKMGSTIGFVGMTGFATGPHLHLELRVNNVARDPRLALQSKSGARLPSDESRLFRKVRSSTFSVLDSGSRPARLASSGE